MLVDVSERLVVIIGGGAVAVRKAKGLIAAGAKRIRCVALEFDASMPGGIQRIEEAFAPRHLDGANLVFAVTDSPAVNDAVVQEAHRRGLLVNRADVDDEQPGDFSTPAIWKTDAMLVAVSAGGSAALAAKIRDDLAGKIDPNHVKLAEAMQEIRPMIRQRVADIARRRELFRELVGEEAMRIVADGGTHAFKKWAEGKLG